ncbi:MAG TPA: 50S ribosomal protein L30 [Desulfomicrobiaceae bacterium]|jgi:large subunit ribosomal protein L30|nr:50S ribosomal protein L30 [Desulfomicrobiaceae bacterium]
MVKVTLKKSKIGMNPQQARTVKALGLNKIGRVRTLPDNDCVRGMIAKVQHLVEVEK